MYISREDLAAAVSRTELIQLSNDDGYGSEPDWAIVDRAIAYACELADGYLMGRYTLPLDPAPSLLRPICTDIARWWLHQRRINTADFPKPLEAAHANAVKLLEQIRDGKIHLGVRVGDTAEPSGGAVEQAHGERGAYQVRANSRQDWSGY
ncbi:gp436 family protein [Neisseria animalis]|uniref:DUF1320 domain-containing protein n=1 Tax=Neisseria animalis TaxID=492 RepID=A0A5P3MPS0_NEIAN|nr:DUF1320 domain-containing protein [Neisseria animalis]QEY23546.1 DUF1320 domain-containing protein [Neisseria animalis]ROW32146.1 DUF1320 domain-containing protein [Neisseria animalis]VEE09190.1 phage protein [Neisseria animalis]